MRDLECSGVDSYRQSLKTFLFLHLLYENVLYKFTFDIDIDIDSIVDLAIIFVIQATLKISLIMMIVS